MQVALLIFATFIWGAGFVGTRWTLNDFDPVWSNSLRFIFAGILSIPILILRKKKINYFSVLICALVLLIALQLQTIGIKYTTLAKSGFLTTFYAIFTPILSMIFYKNRYPYTYWIIVAMAIFGIFLLCDMQLSNINEGDLYILASAIFFSFHILAIDKLAQSQDSISFNLAQCIFMGIFGGIGALLWQGAPDISSLLTWKALTYTSALYGFLILSIFSSILAFSIQIVAQKGLPIHIVSTIFLMESIFAAIFGHWLFAEELSSIAILGMTIVIISVSLIAFLPLRKP